jgi:phosphonopyruvate decarboxylase
MIEAQALLDELKRAGFGLFTGVPCSYLTPVINAVIDDPELRYVPGANEGDCVAIACGAELGGVRSLVMFQNSGFGNAVNPLTSLTATLELPILVVVTWRGHPEQPPDEPQHHFMGRITTRLLDLLEIPWEPFPDRPEGVGPVVGRAIAHMEAHRTPYALILSKGAVAPRELRNGPDLIRDPRLESTPEAGASRTRLDPDAVLAAIQESAMETDVLLATTGYSGRALYAIDDRPNQLYMVGSMGCVSSLALGLASVRPERRAVAIDGDGAVLMRMGALSTIGHERPPNLLHVVLDNAVYDSTGGQATVSPSVDLASIAAACGYSVATRVESLDHLREEVSRPDAGPRFLHVRTLPRSNRRLPRPKETPPEVVRRLQSFLRGNG